jgi:probable addiction module antidote protein
MPKRTGDYRSALLEDLKEPREAALYLTEALRESEEMFLMALRDVAEARQMAKVAEGAGIARESLYRMLSPSGNPTYHNLIGIFRALGVEFSQVLPRHRAPSEVRPSDKRPVVKKRQRLTRHGRQ